MVWSSASEFEQRVALFLCKCKCVSEGALERRYGFLERVIVSDGRVAARL